MALSGIILADTFDSRELTHNLIHCCQQASLSVKVIARQFFKKYIDETRESLKDPLLLFESCSHWCPDFKKILDSHRQSPEFPLYVSSDGEILSFNPTKVDILEDGRVLPRQGKSCFFTAVPVTRLLPPVAPPTIIVRAHNRHTYLTLTINSLVHSLGVNLEKVPILLALSEPSLEVERVTLDLLNKYPPQQLLSYGEIRFTLAPKTRKAIFGHCSIRR